MSEIYSLRNVKPIVFQIGKRKELAMHPAKLVSAILFIMLAICLVNVNAKDNPNTINFDNQSGEPALVKLIGPTPQIVKVPNGQKRTVNVAEGEYYILVRYGSSPERYRYSKGDTFTVRQTATQYSAISITLHRVVGGNYPSRKSSSDEFDKATATEPIAEPEKATVYQVQKKLKELGYNPGALDGIWGRKTEAAIMAFQKKNGLSITGKLDSEIIEKLFHAKREKAISVELIAKPHKKAVGQGITQPSILKDSIPKNISPDFRAKIEKLHSKRAPERAGAARYIGKMGKKAAPAIPFLIALLGDTSSLVVRDTYHGVDLYSTSPGKEAARALGSIEVKGIVEPLVAALKDKNKIIQGNAAYALGQLKGLGVVEILLAETRNDRSTVRQYAALALGHTKDSRAVKPLIGLLKDKNPSVRRNAAAALGQIKDESALKPIMTLLKDKNPSVRRYAAEALGEIGDKRALEPLKNALEDKDENVRKNVISALAKFKGSDTEESLIASLKDENAEVRLRAIKSLRDNKGVRILETMIEALKDDSWSIRKEAIDALKDIKDKRAVEPLIAVLKDENLRGMGAWVIGDAAEALGEIGDERAVIPLINVLNDENRYLKLYARDDAAKSLGKLKNKRAVVPLIHALKDESFVVQSNAAAALGQIKDESALKPIMALLKDKNPSVRRYAAKALGGIGDKRALESIMTLLEDRNSSVRSSAAEALGKIGDKRALEPLVNALKDEDERVRRKATYALGNINDFRAIGPLIEMLKDEDWVVRSNAQSALEQITKKNHFRYDHEKWKEWWKQNKAAFR